MRGSKEWLSSVAAGLGIAAVGAFLTADAAMGQGLGGALQGAGQAVQGAGSAVQGAAQGAAQSTQGAVRGTQGAVRGSAQGSQAIRGSAQQGSSGVRGSIQGSQDVQGSARGNVGQDLDRGVRDTVRGARDTARGAADAARETTRDAQQRARQTYSETRDRARDTVDEARDTARETTRSAQDRARDLQDDAADTVRDTRQNLRDDLRSNVRTRTEGRVDADFGTRTNADIDLNNVNARDIGIHFDNSANGLVISSVESNSSLRQLGLQEGDQVTAINRQRVSSQDDFIQTLLDPSLRNQRVPISVTRDGQQQTLYAQPSQLIENLDRMQGNVRSNTRGNVDARFGTRTDANVDLRNVNARDIGITFDNSVNAAVIQDIEANSSLRQLGLQEGDRIVSVNRQRISSGDDFLESLADPSLRDQRVPVSILRDGEQETLYVQPSQLLSNLDQIQGDVRSNTRGNVDARFGTRTNANVDLSNVNARDIGITFDNSVNAVIIQNIEASSPLRQIGLQEGDRVVAVNRQRVTDGDAFLSTLLDPSMQAQRVPITVMRDGAQEILYAQPQQLISALGAGGVEGFTRQATGYVGRSLPIGIVLDNRYPDRVIVGEIEEGSIAARAGLRPGDLISAVGGQRVASPDEFFQMIQAGDLGQLTVYRPQTISIDASGSVRGEERFTTFREGDDDYEGDDDDGRGVRRAPRQDRDDD